MAIREIKRKSGKNWLVYWRDPITKKIRSKCFFSKEDAFNFDLLSKHEIKKYRKKNSKTDDHQENIDFPEKVVLPYQDNELARLKQKCLELYSCPSNRIADIFDFIMEAMSLPIRFRDVLQTAKKVKRENIPLTLRAKILERDGFRCKMCGATAEQARLHIDHIIPVSRGGMTEERNLQTLCEKCNLGKRNYPI